MGHILAERLSERADLRQQAAARSLIAPANSSAPRGEADEKPAQGFRDYFEFNEPLERVPPNIACWRSIAARRPRLLRVKIEADLEAMQAAVDESLVPADHPHADFLARLRPRCACTRLVFPSLEREVRRELTDWAEAHAVEVFARNLRNLLLQTPVRGRRVLAIDPGFKSGCKLAALDEFGNLLDQAVIHLIGKPERRAGRPREAGRDGQATPAYR